MAGAVEPEADALSRAVTVMVIGEAIAARTLVVVICPKLAPAVLLIAKPSA